MSHTRKLAVSALPILLLTIVFAQDDSTSTSKGKSVTVKGYVLDSACAFTKGLKKPISADCAVACAKAGSPLVILTPAGEIYWPIADSTPATEQNSKLLPFAGQNVIATGKSSTRGGSRALVLEHIEAQAAK